MNFAPEIIGVGKYSGELARWLALQGHTVEVVSAQPHYPGFIAQGRGYRRTRENGIGVWRCPLVARNGGRGLWRLMAPASFAITSAPLMLWRTLRFRPDLVLCVEPTLLAAPVSIVGAWLVRAKTVLHVQDLEIDAAFATGQLRSRVMQRLAFAVERTILRAFDEVITISGAMAARLATKGVRPARVSVVRNWIDLAATGEAVSCARSWLSIGPQEHVILYAGHLGAKQGIATLLDGLRRLATLRPVRIVIAGDGPLKPLVEAAQRDLPCLTLLPLQPRARYESLLAMADVHVLPQASCAADLVFPSKLGPMLATGRPVVVCASPESELSTWLEKAAIVVDPDDPGALAAGLAQALDEPAGHRSPQALGLAQTLAAETVLPAFEAVLTRLVDAKPARRGWPALAEPVASQPG